MRATSSFGPHEDRRRSDRPRAEHDTVGGDRLDGAVRLDLDAADPSVVEQHATYVRLRADRQPLAKLGRQITLGRANATTVDLVHRRGLKREHTTTVFGRPVR